MSETELIDISNERLPIEINNEIITNAFENSKARSSRLIVIVIGTKPDFYNKLL